MLACGGGSGGDDWDSTVERFRQAVCVSACVPDDLQQQCLDDVQVDLDQARIELSDLDEADCLDCLDVKASLLPAVAANGCQSTPAQDAQVFAACDLDPDVDFDGDGDPANDDDEACAGFP